MADIGRHIVKARCSVCHGIYDISVPNKEES